MSSRDFEAYLQTTFVANPSDLKPTWLTLVTIDNLPSVANQPAVTDAFILHFYSVGEPLSQGTYELQHSSLGQLRLFVVPSQTQGYDAEINHLLKPLPGPIPTRRRKPEPQEPSA